MASTPQRSLQQRMDALERANVIRSKRAVLKKELTAGRKRIAPFIKDPPDWLETAKVVDLMLAVPKYGRVKVNRIIISEQISPSKTFGGLSARQRDALINRLGGRA